MRTRWSGHRLRNSVDPGVCEVTGLPRQETVLHLNNAAAETGATKEVCCHGWLAIWPLEYLTIVRKAATYTR